MYKYTLVFCAFGALFFARKSKNSEKIMIKTVKNCCASVRIAVQKKGLNGVKKRFGKAEVKSAFAAVRSRTVYGIFTQNFR